MRIIEIGIIDYEEGITLQSKIWEEVNQGAEDAIILCEHPHVYTFGKSANTNHLLIQQDFLQKINASVHQTERGGDITYHGPGQVVGYPIINLRRKHWGVKKYVATLEDTLINTLKSYDIHAYKMDNLTGIWVEKGQKQEAKIGAIGIRIKNGVSYHGFALNVHTDLSYFNHIVPCGITDKDVTSLQDLNLDANIENFKKHFIPFFLNHFESIPLAI
jgi:lipoyl(octanoyl) transferase